MVERFTNNVTYRVRDLVSAEQRQLTRDQFKVVELPARFGSPPDPNSSSLPRLLVAGDAAHVTPPMSEVADEAVDVPSDDEPPPLSTIDDEQQDPVPVAEELVP